MKLPRYSSLELYLVLDLLEARIGLTPDRAEVGGSGRISVPITLSSMARQRWVGAVSISHRGASASTVQISLSVMISSSFAQMNRDAAIAASSVGGAKVNGGARGAVSQKFLDYAVGQAMPLIEQSLLHEKFDDIKGKSGHIDYSVTDIKVSKFKISSPKLAFIKDKGLKISLSGISIAGVLALRLQESAAWISRVDVPASIYLLPELTQTNTATSDIPGSMHWKWKETKWPHPSGSGTADFSVGGSTHGTGLIELATARERDSSLTMQIQSNFSKRDDRSHTRSRLPTNANANANTKGDIARAIKLLKRGPVSLDHFSIKIHHSALSWLYDVIFDAFEHTIKKSMEKSIQDAMKDAIDDDLNKVFVRGGIREFATMPLSTPIPFEAPFDVAELRYDFLDIETKDDHIAVTIRGSVNDTDAKRPSYPSPPPHLPASNASIYGHHHLTMQLSTYSLDSAMYVFYNRGLLSYEVTQKDLDSKTGFLLNTDTFLLAAPGLKQWPDHNMTIVASIAQLPKTSFEADQAMNLEQHNTFKKKRRKRNRCRGSKTRRAGLHLRK
eukprot:jgi/Bigna1/77506/fgenesh1_pg.48_\